MDDIALRTEAKRLASLTEEQLKEEAIYQALRLGAVSDEAADNFNHIYQEIADEFS